MSQTRHLTSMLVAGNLILTYNSQLYWNLSPFYHLQITTRKFNFRVSKTTKNDCPIYCWCFVNDLIIGTFHGRLYTTKQGHFFGVDSRHSR